MKTKHAKPQDYISDIEFNQMVARNNSALPWDDSKGDSAVDEVFETDMGENYPEEITELDAEKVTADFNSAPRHENGLEERIDESSGVRSSSRPDPREDLDAPTSSH